MNIELKKVNGKDYKVVNGTFYTSNTNNEIIEVLENARKMFSPNVMKKYFLYGLKYGSICAHTFNWNGLLYSCSS